MILNKMAKMIIKIFRKDKKAKGKKYKLTKETIKVCDHTLYRIQALRDFDGVKKGDLGGFIESEDNLSHEGNSWVFDNAMVFGEGKVFDNARIYNNVWVYYEGKVYGNAKIYDKVKVYQGGKVYDNAQIFGNAEICEGLVFGKAKVGDRAEIYWGAKVYGRAKVFGNIRVTGYTFVYDYAQIYGKGELRNRGKIWGLTKICNNKYIRITRGIWVHITLIILIMMAWVVQLFSQIKLKRLKEIKNEIEFDIL